MYPHNSTFPHLKCKLAFTPRVTGLKLSWSGFVVQRKGSPERDPSPLDVDVHGQVEELGVPVPHLVLAEQKPDQIFGCCLVSDAQGFVFDV